MRRSAIVPLAFNSASQIGAGTSPPAGNFMETIIVPPDSVPVSVPFLTLWHEPHVPSVGSTALISAVPEMAVPDCVRTHVTSSGLNESDPVPVHVPLSTTGAGTGGGGTGATGPGAVASADDIDPHAASHAVSAPSNTTSVIL